MCRFLAYVASSERSLRDAAGEPDLAAYQALSRIHRDGWGAAWLAAPGGDDELRARRSVLAAQDDPGFDNAADDVTARAGLVHLRWATAGLPVNPANTHPFVADGWAFAHNGFVRGYERLEPHLSGAARAALTGDTDSERYFRLVLDRMERAGDPLTGIQEAVALIADVCGPVSLNAVLLSDHSLFVVSGLTGARPPIDDLLALVDQPDELPPDHVDAYYRVRYRLTPECVVVASSGLPGADWLTQPADSVLAVDIATGRLAIHPLIPATSPITLATGATETVG